MNSPRFDPVSAVVVGLGSPQGDDRVGWDVVDRFAALGAGVPAVKIAGALDLLEWFEGRNLAILVDASAPAGRPGRVRRLVWPCDVVEADRLRGSHDVGVAEAMRLAEALGRLPRRVVIIAVEAAHVAPGAEPSPSVAAAVELVVHRIVAELDISYDREAEPCTSRP